MTVVLFTTSLLSVMGAGAFNEAVDEADDEVFELLLDLKNLKKEEVDEETVGFASFLTCSSFLGASTGGAGEIGCSIFFGIFLFSCSAEIANALLELKVGLFFGVEGTGS